MGLLLESLEQHIDNNYKNRSRAARAYGVSRQLLEHWVSKDYLIDTTTGQTYRPAPRLLPLPAPQTQDDQDQVTFI